MGEKIIDRHWEAVSWKSLTRFLFLTGLIKDLRGLRGLFRSVLRLLRLPRN